MTTSRYVFITRITGNLAHGMIRGGFIYGVKSTCIGGQSSHLAGKFPKVDVRQIRNFSTSSDESKNVCFNFTFENTICRFRTT